LCSHICILAAAQMPMTEMDTNETLPGAPELRNIVHPSHGEWLKYRKTLRPRYWIAWCEISMCIFMVIAGFTAHMILTSRFGNLFGLKIGIPFAIWIGFWFNAILTFGHEAAHYNLSSSHALNDTLADWSIWLFFPQSTRQYRKSHWQHHLHLGDSQDTEVSYHNCLSPWFLAQAITGIYLVTLVFRYVVRSRAHAPIQQKSNSPSPDGDSDERRNSQHADFAPVLRAAATHALFIGFALILHLYASALTWLVAVALIFPFLASVRQIMEHRAAEAACATDFRVIPHGPVNRMFGKDIFSHYFGAAGFNRHILHHWDPTVSYTCFDDMESFFNATVLGEPLSRAGTTYFSSAILLLKKSLDE
jgi:fatty acid desaturase